MFSKYSSPAHYLNITYTYIEIIVKYFRVWKFILITTYLVKVDVLYLVFWMQVARDTP